MTERVRLEVDDAELEAVINRLDEAILKKAELLDIQIPQRLKEKEVIVEADTSIPRRLREEAIVEADIQIPQRLREEVIAETDIIEAYVDATRERLIAEILGIEQAVDAVEVSAEMTIQGIITKLSGVQTHTETLRKVIRFDLEQIRVEGAEAEAKIRGVQALARDLPQVDRATRMLLLRIPGLREVLRLLYIIKMEERTLRLGGIRGPLTAAITTILYMSMLLQSFQRRQEVLEARMNRVEADMNQRFITMEEAVRGYSELPERYRSTVII